MKGIITSALDLQLVLTPISDLHFLLGVSHKWDTVCWSKVQGNLPPTSPCKNFAGIFSPRFLVRAMVNKFSWRGEKDGAT